MLKSIGPRNIKRKRNRKNDSKKDPGLSSHKFLTLDNIETNGKRVFLRVDINVPLDPSTHQILDDTRIRAVSETLARLEDARVVLGSHQSRPGKDDFTSLEPHAQALAQYCNQEIKFVDDVIGPQARQRIGKVEPGQVLVLDNLRFCAEENIDDRPEKLLKTHFVKQLTPLFDLNVNDAFATAHRSQPSIVGLAEALPSVAGRLMEKELKAISGLLQEPRRPCVHVLGGAKVEDKIPVIEHILSRNKADKILLGGVPAKIFLKAMDKKISHQDEEDMAKCNGYTIIGGGHIVGLASILGIDQSFKHVSTAGGAMLSLLSGQSLPGVDALVRASARMHSQRKDS